NFGAFRRTAQATKNAKDDPFSVLVHELRPFSVPLLGLPNFADIRSNRAGVVARAAFKNETTQSAWVAGMAQGTPSAPPAGAPETLPAVTVVLHYGSARPTTHHITDVSFVLGTVPGCDLRLPGANLPSVVCVISRHPSGVTLRKLAPVLPILLN